MGRMEVEWAEGRWFDVEIDICRGKPRKIKKRCKTKAEVRELFEANVPDDIHPAPEETYSRPLMKPPRKHK